MSSKKNIKHYRDRNNRDSSGVKTRNKAILGYFYEKPRSLEAILQKEG
jgi:hypothetical protein